MSSNLRRLAPYLTLLLISTTSCANETRTPDEQSSDLRARAKELVEESSGVVRDLVSRIPPDQRERARCVVVVPALVSGGIVVGAQHGNGVVTCRTPSGWSGPAFVSITGGSAGLQLGIQSADVVMLINHERGLSRLFRSSFELGAGTSAAAGPAGGAAQASTDETMTAEIVSYAKSRGLFAGVELSGAAMAQNRAAGGALYGGSPDVHAILSGEVTPPTDVAGFLDAMRSAFPSS
jgi:lipid-binding SYLF domain-containing protein